MKITLDSEEIKDICIDATTFAITAEGERSLVRLLNIQEQINAFVEQVKEEIVEKAKTIDGDFTSIKGDVLKIEYRECGSKFTVVDPETVHGEFVTLTERLAVNTKAVEHFMVEHDGELPAGIQMVDRKKSIIIKRKDK